MVMGTSPPRRQTTPVIMHRRGCCLWPHFSTAQTLVCTNVVKTLPQSWREPAPAHPTRHPSKARKGSWPATPPPPSSPPAHQCSSITPAPQEHSRLWRCVQVRPGMRREEQPRQRVLFTEGSLRVQGEGGLSACSSSRAAGPAPASPSARRRASHRRKTSRFAMVLSVWQ